MEATTATQTQPELEPETEEPEVDLQAHATDTIGIFSANLALLATDLFQVANKIPETTVSSIPFDLRFHSLFFFFFPLI